MNESIYAVISSGEQVDCFGDFNKNDPLCAKYCALRLRCVIEQDQNIRTEILEQLVANENGLTRIQ